ncbi:hypothetical protein Tco_0847878 [Tanacetum coccineum]
MLSSSNSNLSSSNFKKSFNPNTHQGMMLTMIMDHVPSAKETEPFKTDESAATPPPPPVYRTTVRMSIRAQTPIPFPSEVEVDRLLAIPTPPSSPLTLLSSPLPRIPSPPFPVPSPLTTSLTNTGAPLGYREIGIRLRTSSPLPLSPPIILPCTRASMVMMRAAAPSTYCLVPPLMTPPSGTSPLLPIPLPTSSPHLLLPSTDCIADVLEEDTNEIAEEIPATDVAELGQRMSVFVTIIRQDTYEIYRRLNDTQDDKSLMSGQLNLLRKDRNSYIRTARLIEGEVRASREAWSQSMDASDTARSDVRALRTMTRMVALQKNTSEEAPRTTPATATATTPMTDAAIRTLISRGVADALAEHEIQRNNNLNSDGSQGSRSNISRPARPTHECTYTEFLKCQPMNFKGTEGVVGLTQWFERMETVFNISNCAVENQVKFATCTLHGVALTWWKSYVKTVGQDAAHGMP